MLATDCLLHVLVRTPTVSLHPKCSNQPCPPPQHLMANNGVFPTDSVCTLCQHQTSLFQLHSHVSRQHPPCFFVPVSLPALPAGPWLQCVDAPALCRHARHGVLLLPRPPDDIAAAVDAWGGPSRPLWSGHTTTCAAGAAHSLSVTTLLCVCYMSLFVTQCESGVLLQVTLFRSACVCGGHSCTSAL